MIGGMPAYIVSRVRLTDREAMRTLVAAALLLAVAANAEESCGTMLRTPIRFRGTIRSVTARDVRIETDDQQSLTFPVAGVAEEFATKKAIGKTFDFQAERMDCDGSFRRNLRLQPRSGGIEAYDGWLEVGHTYRGEVTIRDRFVELVPWPRVPYHHSSGILWTNADEIRAPQTVVFEVVSLEITYRAEWQWESLYTLRIVEPGKTTVVPR